MTAKQYMDSGLGVWGFRVWGFYGPDDIGLALSSVSCRKPVPEARCTFDPGWSQTSSVQLYRTYMHVHVYHNNA